MMNNIDITGIRSKMKELDNKMEMDSLEEYLNIAKKIISKYASKLRYGLAEEMLNNDDAISNVAHAIMVADCQYNGTGTRFGFRKDRAQFAIKNYINRKAKQHASKKTFSLDNVVDHSASNETFSTRIEDSHGSPHEIIERNDYNKKIQSKLIESRNKGDISELGFNYIKMYYFEGMTFHEIATLNGVTRQAVQQLVNRSVNSLRQTWKDVSI